ncbi:MAG: UDP-N-acetylmuramoyl-tripeptide--D-alanyl-D-alanine ligase [Deltaproteobacteria bacterium]|nr:UDP-N-acetylmuramoyl-tripeptide--D-alanyl-D-alanine ligase [Deltaproteobacteria bacterium]MBW1913620.1 UDP-N-acetylmuramoyl-tripeptide--D-alanyl-D-alanine ligase [Deltaproteobacteria bacterium]
MTVKWGDIGIGDVIFPIQGKLISGDPETLIFGISTDSRDISPGEIFLALGGKNYDGHNFIDLALEKGASGVIIEQGFPLKGLEETGHAVIAVADTLKALGDLAHWWRHQHDVQVAAITGSVGKTTTKEMTACILELGTRTLKTRGNLNNLIGLPLTILGMKQEDSRAVLEMGMNLSGEISRLTEIADPDIGLITNVAKAHLEGLSNIMGVALAKAELLERISPEGRVLLNGDDELLMKVAAGFKQNILTYGIGQENDFRAENVQNMGPEGISFELHYQGNCILIRLNVPGPQNVYNGLAAAAIAICMGSTPDQIAQGLGRFNGVKGRFMLIDLPAGVTLLDDTYNSNPSSLRAAIDSVKEMTAQGRDIIIGLGDMLELGDEAVSAHLKAGSWVTELGTPYLLTIGNHAPEIIAGAIDKGLPRERAVIVKNKKEMAEMIQDVMKEGDLILLKGSHLIGLNEVSSLLQGKNG